MTMTDTTRAVRMPTPRARVRRTVLCTACRRVAARLAATLTPLVDGSLQLRLPRGEIRRDGARVDRVKFNGLAQSFGVRPLVELDRHAVELWMADTFPSLAPTSGCDYLNTVNTLACGCSKKGTLSPDGGTSDERPALRTAEFRRFLGAA